MKRWDFPQMTGIQTLSTYADGPRTATELVMSGVSSAGTPVNVNIVVQTSGGKIESFR
jgi:hypothetical protein